MMFKKILIVSACVLTAACGKGGNTNNSTSVTSTTNTTRASNTTATPAASATPAATTESAASPAAAKVTRPEDAAQGLFNAWKAKDRAAASKFATSAAITSLFSEGSAEGLKFEGCNKEDDIYNCAYSYEGGALFMTLAGNEAEGYKVTATGFIAD